MIHVEDDSVFMFVYYGTPGLPLTQSQKYIGNNHIGLERETALNIEKQKYT